MPMSDFMPMHVSTDDRDRVDPYGRRKRRALHYQRAYKPLHLSNFDFLIHPENSPKPLSSHKRVKRKRQKGEIFLVPL